MIKPPTEAVLERKLKALERKYDKNNAHLRNYRSDLVDIQTLVTNGKIDRQHGEILAEEARRQFEEADTKAKMKREAEQLSRQSWWRRTFGP